MQSNKVNLEKREFAVQDPAIEGFQLTCWQRRQEQYSIHIFSAIYPSAESILDNYTLARDYIAIFFQSETLELDIERWNMYEFIFVQGLLSEAQKQLIEQDKFATRKLVFDGLSDEPDEDYIRAKIITELFSFEVKSRTTGNIDIREHMDTAHPETMHFMDEDEWEDNTILTNALINTLGHAED